MPRLSGIYEDFSKDIEAIPLEDLLSRLHFKMELHQLENFIGNRILYPQTIANTPQEMEIDLAVLKIIIAKNPKNFFNESKSSLTLSRDLLLRFSSRAALMAALSEVLPLKEVTKVFEKEQWAKVRFIGTIVNPQGIKVSDTVFIYLNGKLIKLKYSPFFQLNEPSHSVSFKINDKQLSGVGGGEVGICLDLRKIPK